MQRSARSTSRQQNIKSVAALVAVGGFLALSLWLGDELWSFATYWPATGMGFGATVGVLLPVTFSGARHCFRRASSDGSPYSPGWVAAGLVCAAVALVSALAASRAIPGKGSSSSCRSEWQPCWVNHLYPEAFLVTLGSFAATVAVMYWLPPRLPGLRRRLRR
ncbi:hypothetical protein C9J60_06765 [Streptomyces sp. A244]|uniref:hypothetical protein n=1 Tax=Streptomyces sp. A244 TaxID=2137016 RepID=UPI000D1A3EFB|nr:hypothetical protein [Streptomyces sp. A244]PTH88563.1 hypothetical protein C9J60_06765 [Streptomyces sp. A244]